MRPTVILTWGVALLLAIGIAAASLQARSTRIAKCSRVGDVTRSFPVIPKDACSQARVREEQTLIAAAVSAVVVVMGTAVALALQKRDERAHTA